MKRALVLGGTGLIGGHVIRQLLAAGYHVRAFRRPGSQFQNLPDLQQEIEICEGTFDDPDSLRRAFAGQTHLLHCAMPYPIYSLGWHRRWPSLRAQLRNLLSAAREHDLERMVFTSVCSTIGRSPDPNRLADETLVAEPSHASAIAMKQLAEQEILYAARAGLPAVVVNPCCTFGPYDSKPSSGQFLLHLIRSPLQVLTHHPINVVDARDVAAAHVTALERGEIFTHLAARYLLGSENTTFAEVARLAHEELGLRPRWKIRVPTPLAAAAARMSELTSLALRRSAPTLPLLGLDLVRYGSQHVDTSRAARELQLPHTPLTETLRDTLHYFMQTRMLRIG